MVDHLTKDQRSYCMSRVRSKWTSPERKFHNHLKGRKISHRMHPDMEGSPDIIFPKNKVAVFIDGCFWHGCTRCYRKPKANKDFWEDKLKKNMRRDRSDTKILKCLGWKVIRFWEHEIKEDVHPCFEVLLKYLES